jgi:polysaccharide export outer membrane protein
MVLSAVTVWAAPAQRPDSRYALQRGDVLELNFPFVPTFTQTVTVRPDGYVTLRLVGELQAAGKTVSQFTEDIRAAYASVLRDPLVTVEIKDFEKPYFIVAGEVERPGRYDLRGVVTATQAVAIAGGLKLRAKDARAVVFRRSVDGAYQPLAVDLKKVLKEARLENDLSLEPGDMLFVPKARALNFSALGSTLWLVPYLLDRF